MPFKAPVVCRAYSCRNATTNKNGYCDDCADQAGRKRRQKKGDPFYWSTPWKKFRAWYIRRNPLCEECLKRGLTVPADVVDHIIEIKDGGARLSEDNAKSLCNRCHARKTAEVKRQREGRFESPPTPPVQPFGSQT